MFCSKCGQANGEAERFCRKCGNDLPMLSIETTDRSVTRRRPDDAPLTSASYADALSSKGVASVIIGDGFFMVAVILAATESAVSSMLWLFLLIPAFFFFGKGFADVIHARQIRKRTRRNQLEVSDVAQLSAGQPSAFEMFERVISGELSPLASVTERTTKNLK